MSSLSNLFRSLRLAGQRPAVKREIDEELRFHIERRTADNIAAGMTPDEAARAARKRFGNLQGVREECRTIRGIAWLDNFFQDFSFGCRLWRKQPVSFFSAVAAMTMGIGLVTFALCAVNCVFYGKLPFPEANRIVYATVPQPELRDFQAQQTSFEALAEYASGSANFKALNVPERLTVCHITPNFLAVVGAGPLMGRGLTEDDAKPGAAAVALIGYDLWQREFSGSKTAIGSVVRIDERPVTVVGIMPEGFKFPIADQLWLPGTPGAPEMSGWGYGFGRLKRGVTAKDAAVELNLIAARLSQINDGTSASAPREAIKVGPFTRLYNLKGSYGPAPGVIALAVITLLVLLIACANVAGLTLARASERGTELAMRGALGATRARLIGQILVENLILAAAGAVGGVLIIAILSQNFRNWFASQEADFSQAPAWMRIEIDGRVLLALVGVIFLANLMAGLWPALQATKCDVNDLLKARSGGTAGTHTGKLRWCLVVMQVAFSAVVLVIAVNLLSYSRQLREVHPPFDPKEVLTARLDLPARVDARQFQTEIEQNLAGVSGVQAVGLSGGGSFSGGGWQPISIEGQSYPRPEDHPRANPTVVSAGYFQTLNYPVLAGRDFNRGDLTGSLPVAIVNSTFAKWYLPPGDPLGRRIREGTNAWMTVVGVAPDIDFDPADETHAPTYYVPLTQLPRQSLDITLRCQGKATEWAKALAVEVARVQPDVPIYRVATLEAVIEHQIIGYYLASLLLAVCGVGSLFLATLGIFGLISLSVTQRTREIGVRLALGARRSRIVGTLLRQAGWQVAIGLVLGTTLALALNGALAHSISGYPVAKHPVLVSGGAILFLASLSFVAVLVPAIRGARVEPMTALRYE